MPISRRDFLKASALVAAIPAGTHPLLARFGRAGDPVPALADPALEELAGRALDAAHSAGATYADVRLTRTMSRIVRPRAVGDQEQLAVGVRALADGYWGFASGPVWSADEMARLGAEAVHEARVNAIGGAAVTELAPAAAVPKGHWVMPVEIDPFAVSPLEIADYLQSLAIFTARIPHAEVWSNQCAFTMQEKVYASTVGSYCTQRTYLSQGELVLQVRKNDRVTRLAVDLLSPAGVGWELYRHQPLHEAIRRTVAEAEEDLSLPVKPVDVGRYDAVFSAPDVANLLHQTLAPATQLDRALGEEANAGGTSYLNRPFEMLGQYQVGASALTVTGNRSERGGCATVQWDDDGVAPEEFTLVKDGVLVDFQTTRESAAWMKDYYAKIGKPVRSHGCASAESAIDAPLQTTPNLVMHPGREALDFDALVSGLEQGIAVKGAQLNMDFQHLNGLGAGGRVYEVKRGKRVAMIAGAGFLFRAPELWKGLRAVGGRASVRRVGMASMKGEPGQQSVASVTAPPTVFAQLTVIDPLRRA
ncbi:MAG: TldD/PmbA family protein [Gemmatimonadaceae bacterium]|nr:TldD/PmbA family protein [Gemmatimonadaceae bacterium]